MELRVIKLSQIFDIFLHKELLEYQFLVIEIDEVFSDEVLIVDRIIDLVKSFIRNTLIISYNGECWIYKYYGNPDIIYDVAIEYTPKCYVGRWEDYINNIADLR